jgi:hypothetical protein
MYPLPLTATTPYPESNITHIRMQLDPHMRSTCHVSRWEWEKLRWLHAPPFELELRIEGTDPAHRATFGPHSAVSIGLPGALQDPQWYDPTLRQLGGNQIMLRFPTTILSLMIGGALQLCLQTTPTGSDPQWLPLNRRKTLTTAAQMRPHQANIALFTHRGFNLISRRFFDYLQHAVFSLRRHDRVVNVLFHLPDGPDDTPCVELCHAIRDLRTFHARLGVEVRIKVRTRLIDQAAWQAVLGFRLGGMLTVDFV